MSDETLTREQVEERHRSLSMFKLSPHAAAAVHTHEHFRMSLTCLAAMDERDALRSDLDRLRGFAERIMRYWPEGDVDGGELQEAAIAFGLLAGHEVTEPCGEYCNCAEWGDWPRTCYLRTKLIGGDVETPPMEGKP